MKKEYYIQAANSVKEMAIATKKRQTNVEKETQALFFWILKHLVNNIKYSQYCDRDNSKYCLEIQNSKLGNIRYNTERLLCSSDRYRKTFAADQDFEKVIKRVVNIFNNIKGYKAKYFPSAKFGDIIITLTLNVEDLGDE